MTSTSLERKVMSIPGPLVQDVEAIVAIYHHSKSVDAAREHLRKALGQKLAQEVA